MKRQDDNPYVPPSAPNEPRKWYRLFYWQMVPAVITAILGIRGTFLFYLVTEGWLRSISIGDHTLQLAEVLAMVLLSLCAPALIVASACFWMRRTAFAFVVLLIAAVLFVQALAVGLLFVKY